MPKAPDAATCAATHRAAFTQSRPWGEAEFTSFLASPGIFACGDHRAFALVRVVADEAELLTLATRPDHQRQGLAQALMTVWQDTARTQGATRAFLEVAADNAPARALYYGCGYQQAGLRAAYYPRNNGQAVDALLLARDLTQG